MNVLVTYEMYIRCKKYNLMSIEILSFASVLLFSYVSVDLRRNSTTDYVILYIQDKLHFGVITGIM